ncbi:hypothetical protein [Kaistella solincola]|nr:hypothetical protein [Kaistella solincola]
MIDILVQNSILLIFKKRSLKEVLVLAQMQQSKVDLSLEKMPLLEQEVW